MSEKPPTEHVDIQTKTYLKIVETNHEQQLMILETIRPRRDTCSMSLWTLNSKQTPRKKAMSPVLLLVNIKT